jgi:hypothetical protein
MAYFADVPVGARRGSAERPIHSRRRLNWRLCLALGANMAAWVLILRLVGVIG